VSERGVVAFPPTINCGTPDTGWHATDRSVTCTASDSSGLANTNDSSFTLSTSVDAGTETDNAYTGTKEVCDTHNNCASAGPFGPFKIDKKAPVVSCDEPDDVWHITDQSVTCTATDGGSGPASQSVALSTSVAFDVSAGQFITVGLAFDTAPHLAYT
jgi:hypothetical protein